MSAPSYEILYDFESGIEHAVKTLFTAGGLRAFKQSDLDDSQSPYVAVQLSGISGQQDLTRDKQGALRDRTFTASLQCVVVTHRTRGANQHAIYRTKIRAILYDFAARFTEAVLPYYQITICFESGTTPATNSENNEDISDMTWAIRFSIRPGAWPA